MMRLCFPLVVLLHGIVANQSDCPMDSDGIQRCSENLVVDDSTALMQNRGFQKPAEMLQLSHLLKQKGVADRSNVASMAGKMRELALNSANGQGVSDEVKNVLVTVKDVQIKAILDSVQSEHDNDLKLLDQARGLIEVCNAVVETEFQTSGGINAQAADSAQKGVALSECRTAEKNALGIKTEKCTDYDLFLTGLQNIPTCAGNLPEPGPKLVKCKKDIEAWSNSYTAASYETKQGDCTTNTNEHAAKKAACDAEQVTFEADYCAYGQLLTTTCAEQTTCFEQEGNAKQQICTNALAAAGLRQTEYIASKKVVCYIDVLVSDDEAAAKKAALQACDKAVDATSLEIACPDSPSKGACKTDVLLPKPCDDCAECTLAAVHPAPEVQSVEASTATLAAPAEVLVVRADKRKGNFDSASRNSFLFHADDESAANHMVLGSLNPDDYKQDGAYTFKVLFKRGARTIEAEWSQISWLTNPSITGFKPISITDTGGQAQWGQFVGLQKCARGESVLCTPYGWWVAVGQISTHNGGIPAWPQNSWISDTSELFVISSSTRLKPVQTQVVSAAPAEVLVVRADKREGNFDSASRNSFLFHADDESAANHMVLGSLNPNDYKQDHLGAYTFKVLFKKGARTIEAEWSQTSWLTNPSITGFKPISITDTGGQAQWGQFVGLQKCARGESVLCTPYGWWVAVGQTTTHNGGIPAWPQNSWISDTSELYVVNVA